VYTPQRKRQQERAHTLRVTALEFSAVLKLKSACRERHCKTCLTGSLHAHAFPKMLRIPALDHSKPLRRIHPLLFLPPCVLLCFINLMVRKIGNEASSCPGIFSRTLRFYYFASSPKSNQNSPPKQYHPP